MQERVKLFYAFHDKNNKKLMNSRKECMGNAPVRRDSRGYQPLGMRVLMRSSHDRKQQWWRYWKILLVWTVTPPEAQKTARQEVQDNVATFTLVVRANSRKFWHIHIHFLFYTGSSVAINMLLFK